MTTGAETNPGGGNSNQAEKLIQFPGVQELLPKYFGAERKEAVYFCNHCQTPPPVDQNHVAVSVAHDECGKKAMERGIEFLKNLTIQQEIRFGELVNEILFLDPNADVFGTDS